MSTHTSTIAAIATPSGRGGVGIVRLSGPRAADILQKIVRDWPELYPSHKLRLSQIRDPQGQLIDESLVVIMRAPHSYTGEDVVEFQCHGGPVILRRVLDATLHFGATTAEPGQFTQRAFLNGRLDLTQAEAVADLVHATSVSAHKIAMDHLQGQLGQAIRALIEELTGAAVLVEAAIDFSHEEHVYQIERDEIQRRIDHVYGALAKLRRQFDEGRRLREGIRTVILGPANAGKSTLFNLLHGSDRAIVTDIAGTTRDFLEEEVHLGGVALRLIDTAGLRETSDRVEVLGIERSRQLGEQADLTLWLIDRSRALSVQERSDLQHLLDQTRPTVILLNKVDLPDGLEPGDRSLLEQFEHRLETSFITSPPTGYETLVQTIQTIVSELTSSEGVLISRTRHLECVMRCMDALERANNALSLQMEHEFVALDLREALDALGDITGRVSTDDILQRIFSEFCVGK